MKVNQLSHLLVAGAALFLASCASDLDVTPTKTKVSMSSSQTSAAGVAPSKSTGSKSRLVKDLDSSIDNYRRSIGKKPIPRHRGLDRLAQDHCEFMARNKGKFTLGSEIISHYGFEERAFLAEQRYGMASLAENVAGGVIEGDVSSQLVQAWRNSSDHNYNLKQDWNATGIGVHVAPDGTVYATQIFGLQSMSQMALTDRFRQF